MIFINQQKNSITKKMESGILVLQVNSLEGNGKCHRFRLRQVKKTINCVFFCRKNRIIDKCRTFLHNLIIYSDIILLKVYTCMKRLLVNLVLQTSALSLSDETELFSILSTFFNAKNDSDRSV